MDSKLTIEQKVLDGTQVGPVHVDIDLQDTIGTVSMEDSLLDKNGSEIVVEVSDSLGVTGIGDLLEIKNSIDESVVKVEESIAESQKQIDKANEVLDNLQQETANVGILVDQAKAAATTATNKASESAVSATASKNSETNAKASEEAALRDKNAAGVSAAEAHASAQIAATHENGANTALQETLATEVRINNIKDEINSDLVNVQAAKVAAELARDRAVQAEAASATSEANAEAAKNLAVEKASKAEAEAVKATNAATSADISEKAAKVSADAAAVSAKESETARDTTAQLQLSAQQSATAAKASETNAKSSENSAKTSEINSKTSETNSKESETNTKLSEQRTLEYQVKAEDSATNAKVSETNAKGSETVSKTNADTSISKAREAEASAQASEASNVAAKTSADAAKLSEIAAEEWAISKPNNNAKYWAEKAKEYSSKAIVNGGSWTPTAANEYPSTTGITIDTLWKISFPNRGDTYTFTSGAFAGEEVKALDEIMYDLPTGSWSLFKTDATAGIRTIITPVGGSESTPEVEITPQKIGALTQASADARYLGINASAATANKLKTAFDLILDGDATGTVSIDGSGNAILTVVVHDDSHNHVISNIDGLQDILNDKVSSSRTINGKPLTTNITLTSGDVGALPANTVIFSGSWNDLSDKPTTFPPSTHSHTWGQISDKPETATRWPTWDELTNKPSVAIQNAVATFTSVLMNNSIITAIAGTWNRGMLYKNMAGDTTVAAIGAAGTGSTVDRLVLGFGATWENGQSGLSVSPTELRYNGKAVYHEDNLPTTDALNVYSKTQADERFLNKTGTAADSNKLGGFDAARFMSGYNSFSTMRSSDLNFNRKSGAIEMDAATTTNKPGEPGNWVWGWQTSSSDNGSAGKSGAQILINQDGNMYFRVQDASGLGTWNKPYHDNNKPTPQDIGALPTGTSATDIGARPDNWVPTWDDIQNKPTTFPPADHNVEWSQILNKPAEATRWPSWTEVTSKPSDLLTQTVADTLYFRGTSVGESSKMKTFYTGMSGQSSSVNSPISIRERDKVGNTSTDNKYAPNINFNWNDTISKDFWMDKDGVMHYGGYDALGIPSTDGTLSVGSLIVGGSPVSTSVDFNFQEASATVSITRQSYNTVVVLGNGTHTVSVDTTDFKAGDKITVIKSRANNTNTTITLINGGSIMSPAGSVDVSAYFTGAGKIEITRVSDTGNFYITDLNQWGNQ